MILRLLISNEQSIIKEGRIITEGKFKKGNLKITLFFKCTVTIFSTNQSGKQDKLISITGTIVVY